jgi:hypothetical protein
VKVILSRELAWTLATVVKEQEICSDPGCGVLAQGYAQILTRR